jgi:hypothetical protein
MNARHHHAMSMRNAEIQTVLTDVHAEKDLMATDTLTVQVEIFKNFVLLAWIGI